MSEEIYFLRTLLTEWHILEAINSAGLVKRADRPVYLLPFHHRYEFLLTILGHHINFADTIRLHLSTSVNRVPSVPSEHFTSEGDLATLSLIFFC